jgi:hypothetical protein
MKSDSEHQASHPSGYDEDDTTGYKALLAAAAVITKLNILEFYVTDIHPKTNARKSKTLSEALSLITKGLRVYNSATHQLVYTSKAMNKIIAQQEKKPPVKDHVYVKAVKYIYNLPTPTLTQLNNRKVVSQAINFKQSNDQPTRIELNDELEQHFSD